MYEETDNSCRADEITRYKYYNRLNPYVCTAKTYLGD